MSAHPDLPARPDAEPAPDVIGMVVAHRMMRADLARLTAVAEDVAARRTPCDRRRARALAEYVALVCESVHAHHVVEDDVLWPVIAASAGAHVDLTELRDDHAHLDLDSVRAAAATFEHDPTSEDAATALALRLRALHELLDEHIADEERVVFPVVAACVSTRDWRTVEKAAGRSGGRLSFDLPRAVDHTTPDERVRLMGPVGARLSDALLRLVAPSFRRRERLVFGA